MERQANGKTARLKTLRMQDDRWLPPAGQSGFFNSESLVSGSLAVGLLDVPLPMWESHSLQLTTPPFPHLLTSR